MPTSFASNEKATNMRLRNIDLINISDEGIKMAVLTDRQSFKLIKNK